MHNRVMRCYTQVTSRGEFQRELTDHPARQCQCGSDRASKHRQEGVNLHGNARAGLLSCIGNH
ncbi:hypothetical protein D8T51_02805 [Vibrio vulnificus]|nr:hypothetical protein D8T52_13575 [Vibrio vulnificus]RZP83478.1 hypothetical protein D8T51_02805 [Vibrio vulnificus]